MDYRKQLLLDAEAKHRQRIKDDRRSKWQEALLFVGFIIAMIGVVALVDA